MAQGELSAIRWGILGTGKIARDFATNLTKVSGAINQGVFSRKPENVASFSRQFGFASAYHKLSEFLEDSAIDVVYVATPTSFHEEHCLLALEHGKAILCEKPFTLTEEAARKVVETSRSKQLFCMEAMWLRFNPLIQKCKAVIAEGKIGDICALNLEIGYRKEANELGTTNQGLGAMHRFGCYGISLAFFLFGEPQDYQFKAIANREGVDLTAAILLGYPHHTVSITAGVKGTHSNEVRIVGSQGSISIPSPFIDPTNLYIEGNSSANGGLKERLSNKLAGVTQPLDRLLSSFSPYKGSGFRGEIEETMNCLRQGLRESPIMPLDESLKIHRILDKIVESST